MAAAPAAVPSAPAALQAPPKLIGKANSGQFQVNRAVLLERMRRGIPFNEILTQLIDDYGMTQDQARHAFNSLMKEIASANQVEIQSLRALAATRLQRDLIKMRTAKRAPWNAIVRHESLLAELLGLKQHKVEVEISPSRAGLYQAVLDTMSEERLDTIARAQIEFERKAGIAPLQIVETSGEPT